ncbi:tryptophan synthase beta subunit-like PLP-dependent enzyme, partial [Piedraia hortae CBS 480.64]
MTPPNASQRYLSTRGGSYDLSFEDVVLKGLATDGGLFIPEEIPSLPTDWQTKWRGYTFQDLAFEIFSLYISRNEIPAEDLKRIIQNSYSAFRAKEVTPLKQLDHNLYLLELFHGPTFAFKDVALQFLGNLFEYFLVRRNEDKEGSSREHLTVIGATSGDTGSAAIYGLRGKKDVSVYIMHPKGKISPIQEAQMTTVPDANVHNLAIEGTFDDCQDIVKALFADPEANRAKRLGAVNSINWARILAQIVYYFHAYFALCRAVGGDNFRVRFAVPTGNFGDILAGYFATRMGLPTDKLVVATNENDILHRFWQTGRYEIQPVHGREAQGGLPDDGVKAHESGVRETLSPAMDILVSSNFERLLWYLAFATSDVEETNRRRMEAGEAVKTWLGQLKASGGFAVSENILAAARQGFTSERVSDAQTVETIKSVYARGAGVLDPHSAVGVAASLRGLGDGAVYISLATAHPAKFSHAVELALKDAPGFDFETVLPSEFIGLEKKERRLVDCRNDWMEVRKILMEE